MSSEFTFTAGNVQEVRDALREIFLMEIGAEYKELCYVAGDKADEDLEKILRAAQNLAGSNWITTNNMLRALHLLMSAGEIAPKDFTASAPIEEPVEVVDNRPRGRDGKVLTESQVRWAEMTEWTESHSMTEVNARKRVDAQYAAFVRKAYDTEMTHEIDGAVTPVGEPTKSIKATPALIAFVEAYHKASVEDLKPKGGMVRLDGEAVTYASFQTLLVRATNAKLI